MSGTNVFIGAVTCAVLAIWSCPAPTCSASPPSQTAAQDNLPTAKSRVSRSKDTHVVDQIPFFDLPAESPSNTVKRTAQRQIEDSIKLDHKDAPEQQRSGTVIVSPRQMIKASKETTDVERNNSSESSQIPTNEERGRPTVALALGGGGARGAAHIGVLRVLQKEGIPIDYIVGTSMGSIIGGLYSAGMPLDDIEKIALSEKFHKAYIPGTIPAKLLTSPLEKLMHPLKKHYAGLWTGKKFGDFLESQLPNGVENVEDTPIAFSAVATNLIDGKAYRISDGKLSTAIRASSTVALLLQPVAIGDKVYVDGGMRANLPASAARDTGADIVIAVVVDDPLRKLPATYFQHLKGVAGRLLNVMIAMVDAHQLQFADIIICPDVSGIGVINCRTDDVRKAILAGETAAQKALPEIRKRLAERTTLAAQKDAETK